VDDRRWQPLGEVAPKELADARLALHFAAQVVSAAGTTLAPAKPDPIGPKGHRAALRMRDCAVAVVGGDGIAVAEVSLGGRTLEDATARLGDALSRALGWALEAPLKRPEHDLPEHPVAAGAPFGEVDARALLEVERWLRNADALLRELALREPAASPVRSWPHHFDIATLVTIDRDAPIEEARSVGVGLSPGDGSYAEPYFYVTPWPYPKGELPALDGGGAWHTRGFTAAVLTATELLAGGAVEQEKRARAFVAAAYAACRAALKA
jgi:hypothetical protein